MGGLVKSYKYANLSQNLGEGESVGDHLKYLFFYYVKFKWFFFLSFKKYLIKKADPTDIFPMIIMF